jgi:outer membrane protein OmpA-like peptidoglycan-associated protein
MTYLRDRSFAGTTGCSGGCSCAKCSGPTGLGERFIRDDEDDEDERTPAAPSPDKPRPPSTRPAQQRNPPDLGGATSINGFAEPPAATPIDVVGGFAFDKSDLGPPQHTKIIALARQIMARAIRAVRLVGHTDPVGTPTYNKGLGQRRADAVKGALLATLDRMRPGSGRAVTVTAESAGETQPLDRGQAEPARARNRRVEVFLPGPPPSSAACRYDIGNAVAIEREAARRTLALSADVASRFIRTVGAVSARGRFIPTIIDNKYWFAKLYEYTTYYEIAEAPKFRHPAFVLHFVQIFYDLYYQALQNWTAGNRSAVSSLWTIHFTRAGRPDNSSMMNWANGVRDSIVTGATAHIQGDMATALERAYRSYVAKYCIAPPPRLDEFRVDFFGPAGLVVFERSKAALLLHLHQHSPLPVRPEIGQFLFAQGEPLAGGLNTAQVHQWREAAWREAKRRLGQ